MADIDSLDIKIQAGANNAIKSLDKLIGKLNEVQGKLKFDNNGVQNIATSVNGAMKNVGSGMDQSMKKAEKSANDSAKKISKTFQDISNQVKDIGVNFTVHGASKASIQSRIDNLKNEQQRALEKIQVAEVGGKKGSKGWEDAIRNYTIASNKIASLEKQLEAMRFPTQIKTELVQVVDSAKKADEAVEKLNQDLDKRPPVLLNPKRTLEMQKTLAEQTAGPKANQFKIAPITANLEKAGNSIKNINKIFSTLKVTNAQKGLEKLDKAIAQTEKSYKKLVEQMKISASHNPNYTSTAAYDKQQAKLEGLRNEYARLMSMQEALSRVGSAEKMVGGFSKASKILSGIGGLIGSATRKLTGFIAKAVKAHNPFNTLSKTFDKLSKKITRITKMFSLMVTRMAIRKVIENVGTGFKGLALYSAEFDRSISAIINAFKTLGYSISAAVGPLINQFAPALETIAELCMKAVNYVNQLISALTGKGTWIRAKKQVGSFAESLNGVGKAAKGALRPLDELNNLSSNSGGGGGADDLIPEDMFETVDVDSPIKDLASKIKDAWAKADFSDIGSMIGKKLGDSLDKINWPNIQEKAKKIATSITSFIGGFVGTDDLGNKIGQSLAGALNTALAFTKNFVQTMPWGEIGTFIADAFSGFIETLNAESIGETLSGFVDGVITSLTRFFQDADWETLGQKIGDFIGAIDWGKIVWDFTKLVGAFVTALGKAFAGWAETDPLSAGIAALLGVAIVGVKIVPILLRTVPVLTGLGQALALVAGGAGTLHEALTLVFGAVSTTFAGIVAIVGGAVLAVANFVSMLKNGFSWVKEIFMVLGIAIAAVGAVILGVVTGPIAALVAGIVAAVATAVIVIKEHWNEIVSFFKRAWAKFKELATKAVKGLANLIIGIINARISSMVNMVNGIIDLLNKIQIDVPDWVPGLGGKHLGFNITKLVAPQIPTFAQGGFVENTNRYSLFAAGERGIPELLGTVGGKTAVAGGAEITGIADAIYSTSSEEMALLRQQNQLLQGILEKEFGISTSDIGKAARSYGRDFYNRTGNNAFIY